MLHLFLSSKLLIKLFFTFLCFHGDYWFLIRVCFEGKLEVAFLDTVCLFLFAQILAFESSIDVLYFLYLLWVCSPWIQICYLLDIKRNILAFTGFIWLLFNFIQLYFMVSTTLSSLVLISCTVYIPLNLLTARLTTFWSSWCMKRSVTMDCC